MCGFIFTISQNNKVSLIEKSLNNLSFRGPDFKNVEIIDNNVFLAHCRLSIIDLENRSNQPMFDKSKNYSIIYNGEIYNYKEIAKKLNLKLSTNSDTEVVLEGYKKIGNKIFSLLDGMFSLVIYNLKTKNWIATRDAFGIKPLYIYQKSSEVIISSEPKAISELANVTISSISLQEWSKFRSPVPGETFYNEISEILPGQIIEKNRIKTFHYKLKKIDNIFSQAEFENILNNSIKSHEMSDVECTSLVSGGLDSSMICLLTDFTNYYTVGLKGNNEFEQTRETSIFLNKKIKEISITKNKLIENWKYLTRLKGEPILLPNEGLIFEVCKNFTPNEKVVLTGEGADELLFGYDQIFRWSMYNKFDLNKFLNLYGYSDINISERFLDFINDLRKNKKNVDFLEDFFYKFHLPVLLRRMDFASMAAGKEARVPFVNKELIEYMYRQNVTNKLNQTVSKIPLRKYAKNKNADFFNKRKKIGFSAKLDKQNNTYSEYFNFRKIVIQELGWRINEI